jgi:hypothetical protein
VRTLDDLRPAHAQLASAIRMWSSCGERVVDPPFSVLTQRAELLRLPAPGRSSANGSCRLLRCRDGWLAVNLCRPSDRDAVAALLCELSEDDHWGQLEATLPARNASSVVAQAKLLGLAVVRVGEARRSISLSNAPAEDNAGCAWSSRPKVLDLSALWAGPLCGSILAEAGCQVVRVESVARRDTTAERSPEFDLRLNGAKERRIIDTRQPLERARLKSLITEADVIITSARPRGLASFGIADLISKSAACWIAITAHEDVDRVGFGDDCAAAADLLARDEAGMPFFIGDAIADPLTGLTAAATALKALGLRQRGVFRLPLSAVANKVVAALEDAVHA